MPERSFNVTLPHLQGSALDVERPRPVPLDIAIPAQVSSRRSDILAVSALLTLSVLLIWHRFWIWNGLAYLDVATFYMPWYAFLGQHLRELQIPAWNPHQFSGVPFVGDPQSGWMYFPTMFFFAIFPPVAAYKIFLIFHLLMAGISTYVLARVLRLGAFGSLAAAIAFEFGPLSSHIACCLIHVQLAVWVPPALLGIELASRSDRWSARLGWWALTAFAVSQMMAAWVGQGAYNGALVVAFYVVYRNLFSVHLPATFRERIRLTFFGGLVTLGLGVGIAAAGLLPRLDAVRETNVSGGQYSGTGINNYSGPWELSTLLRQTFGDQNGYSSLKFYFGAATVALMLMAPFILRRRHAAPFFFALTVVTAFLTLRTTPIHQLFYLLPRYEVLQQHVPSRITAVQWLGPAMLAGGVIDVLHRGWVPDKLRFIALIPVAVWFLVMIALYNYTDSFSANTLIVVSLACLAVAAFAFAPEIARRRQGLSTATVQRGLSVILLLLVLWDPAGRLFLQSAFGTQTDPVTRIPTQAVTNDAIAENVSATDPGGAGAFLQSATQDGALWRYFGYDDALQYGGAQWPSTYREWYYTPEAISLLINTRATPLGLADAQGYNPVQLKNYVDFLNALNGATQNYHDSQILPSGLASPMLNLLNVRYIVIPNDLSAGRPRPDLMGLLATHREVFRNDQIRVLENTNALPRAWVVHNVVRADRETQLTVLTNNQIDPKQTAIIADAASLPDLGNPTAAGKESLKIANETIDTLSLKVGLSAPGMVVVSQSFANGWRAFVDGEAAKLYLTDGILQGVPVGAGMHTVELRYQPTSLTVGLWITGISGAILAGVWVLAFVDKRRRTAVSRWPLAVGAS